MSISTIKRQKARPAIKRPNEGDLVPFLTITDVPQDTVPVKIFGETYRMMAPQDMSPLRRHSVDLIWQRMLEIEKKVENMEYPDRADEIELEAATDRMVQMIIPSMPRDVFGRLNWAQKEAIVEGFLAWRATLNQIAQTTMEQEAMADAVEAGLLSPIGANSSPDSNSTTTPPTRSSGRKSRRTSSPPSSA